MEIIIYIYNGLTALDAIGPYEVLSRLPKAKVKFVGEQKGVIVTDTHFLKLVAEYDITEISHADILLIPGSTVGFIREAKKKPVLSWIKALHEKTTWTTTVCSGSIILAAAGLLKGLEATSHWGAIHLLKQYGVEPVAKRFIQEGKIITAQGVSAGIDMALYLVSQMLGTEKAKAYQLAIEYFPEPPFESGTAETADSKTLAIAKKIMQEDAFKDLSLADVVKHAQTLVKLKRGK